MRYAGVIAALLAGCDGKPDDAHYLVLEGLGDTDWTTLEANAAHAVVRAERSADRAVLTLKAAALPVALELRTRESCTLVIEKRALLRQSVHMARLDPLLRVHTPENPVGAGMETEVRLEPGCDEARGGTLAWSEHGTPLAAFDVHDAGLRVVLRTRSVADLLPAGSAWGVVPVSARSQGKTELVVVWQRGERRSEQRIALHALSRASGLSNIATGHGVVLGGEHWRVLEQPAGAVATLTSGNGFTQLLGATPGRFRLADAAGRELSLFADALSLPLDCGRADCHRETTLAAGSNPMLHVLQRELDASQPSPRVPCALPCHTSGEPGVHDGGFAHTLERMGQRATPLPAWSELSPWLARAAGVGCVGCHGPARIPEPGSRWKILSSSVCAVCHDAPPRYGHHQALSTSRMARSDAHPELARAGDECARCHTSHGFLAALGVPGSSRRPPPEAEAMGITCAVCHAPHALASGAGSTKLARSTKLPVHALLREPPELPIVDALPQAASKSAVCLACHSSGFSTLANLPATSELWLGQGGIDPKTQEPIVGATPHVFADGCVACHRTSTAQVERGKSHGFAVDYAACGECHTESALPLGDPERAAHLPRELEDRLQALLARAAPSQDAPMRWHAAVAAKLAAAPSNLSLLAADRAAYVHNPTYFRLLLDAATGAMRREEPSGD